MVTTEDAGDPSRRVTASSPTWLDHMLMMVQEASQWMPSAASEPMITFFTVPPGWTRMTGCWNSPRPEVDPLSSALP